MPHDPSRTPNPTFPRLNPSNHRVTSPSDPTYNCIAWAMKDATHWWEPTVFWPAETGDDPYSVESLVGLLVAHGFRPSDRPDDRPVEWLAVYGLADRSYTHAARRLPTGRWTSKLGTWEDIEHDTPDAIAGGEYGEVAAYLFRPENVDGTSD
jgi:hypothetical protein